MSEPRPHSVYRRRRALAIGGSVVAVVLLVWLVGALVGGADPAAPPGPAASSSPPTQSGTSAASSSSTASSSSAASSASASATPAEPPKPTPPPGPPPPCEEAGLKVVAKVDKPENPAGGQVGFAIAVSNAGPLPCAKEIGRAVRELVVTTADGATRLWSSNDCYATAGSEVRVMQPGEVFDYTLRWPGVTSEPGCAKHARLGPGDYLLTARVAGKASDPVVFRLT